MPAEFESEMVTVDESHPLHADGQALQVQLINTAETQFSSLPISLLHFLVRMCDGSKTNPRAYPKSPEIIEEAHFVCITTNIATKN